MSSFFTIFAQRKGWHPQDFRKRKDNNMEDTYIVTIRDIEAYIDEAFKHGIHFSAKDIDGFSAEEYDERLLEALDMLFSDGRLNVITEYIIERWDEPEFEAAMNDIRLVGLLTPARRTKLKFLRDVLEVARPLYHRQAPDFSLPMFGFSNCDFSVKNDELTKFLSSTKHLHLAVVVAVALMERICKENRETNSIVVDSMEHVSYYLNRTCKKDSDEEIKKHLEDAIDFFYDIDNHLELGKRLGLTTRGQYIYDIIDNFICNRYFYNQVDAAKEFDQWMTDNWTGWKETQEEVDKQMFLVREAFENVLCKHGISDAADNSQLIYLFYDLFKLPLSRDDDNDDDEYYLSDDDDEFDLSDEDNDD